MLNLFNRQTINQGLEIFHQTPNAVFIDVREPDEYASGHIPGSTNLPLSRIEQITFEKDRPLFLYCLRGSRSLRAAGILRKAGYTNVKSIGGINKYQGPIEK